MTRTARSAAVAALAALAAVAAIIAADLKPPAAAQSDDETAGRIVARLLEDGRVEFGWQPAGGARVLPRQRYFPTDATVDRWLRSSPVEVSGAEIGRINARQLGDGRIEFAFTPTDGERITPQARYFPADARENRWLRSTEIAISRAAPRYIAVSAGFEHTCAIRTSGAIACWGSNTDHYDDDKYTGQSDAPPGTFRAVSAGDTHTCAIRDTGEITCWGKNEFRSYNRETQTVEVVYGGQTDPPPGIFTAVSVGGGNSCGLRENGEIECWGQGNSREGNFTAISRAGAHTCAIREGNGAIECWGSDEYGQSDAPPGSFTAVSAGSNHTCAIRDTGEIECWGRNDSRQLDAPTGNFTAVSTGQFHACGLRSDGAIACWGNTFGTPPAGTFTAVSTGSSGYHTCALRESGEIACWGRNDDGRTDVPAN